jgi:hypothetical protein
MGCRRVRSLSAGRGAWRASYTTSASLGARQPHRLADGLAGHEVSIAQFGKSIAGAEARAARESRPRRLSRQPLATIGGGQDLTLLVGVGFDDVALGGSPEEFEQLGTVSAKCRLKLAAHRAGRGSPLIAAVIAASAVVFQRTLPADHPGLRRPVSPAA